MKMAQSAHAYVRGNTIKFYEWLVSASAASLVPAGPPVWICGDCHIGNLGPVASAEGQIEIQIRDLDQTVIGNPAHDIIRLSLSLAMAARSSDLPGVTTALMIEQVISGYRQALLKRPRKVQEKDVAPVNLVMRQATNRRWRHLAAERIQDITPKIPLGRRFWALSPAERRELDQLFQQDEVRKLATCLKSRADKDKVKLLDAAYWMKGCSSLGLWRCAALVQVGEARRSKAATLALIDIKEAIEPLAARAKRASMPKHQGERVVAGACALSPSLGERMVPATVLDVPVFVRELLPQDLKFELETLGEDEAAAIGHYLASVVAIAHARQLEPKACAKWLARFRHGNAKNMNAPAWLWAAIVDLVALHEGAYLEHCREHALNAPILPGQEQTIVSHHVTGD